MNRWFAIVPAVVLAGLAALFAFKSLNRDVQFQPDALVGQPAPAVSLTPLEGGTPVSLTSAIKGPALINVFGSWCVACVVEHPILIKVRDAGLPVVGVAWRDKPEKTAAFLRDRGNPYATVLMDPDGVAAIGLGITAAPESFLVDARGVIIAKQGGPLTPEIAEAFVAKAKASASGTPGTK
ncbi:DsbE family thiol:disulfide interchange protein [soil metagenome]